MSLGNRVGPVAIALAAMLVTGLLSACSSSPQPQTTSNAYYAAWAKQDWAAMQQLVSQPPADFTAVNQAAFTNLGVHRASFAPGTMVTSGSTATEPFTARLALAGVGTITIKSTLHLAQVQGHWLVDWTPATIAPQLKAGEQLSLHVTWPARAAILGAGGAPLVTTGQAVTIGVEGARIKDAKAVQAALVAAGAPVSAASEAIAAAKLHPTYFEPVFAVSQARYNQLEPTIYPIPGTVFQSSNARSAITPGLAAGVVGTVGPITAQQLSQLGAPYSAASVVGQTGLEQADERQLAGQPGATVTVVSKSGTNVATVATLPSRPGTPVTTTIDPGTQHAAEAALAGERKSAALVAVNASSGDVLAAVSANSGGFDQAIDGGFPPGSTFKVITSTALITRGLTPRSAASCPGTATVDGEVFHNAEGEAPVSTLLQAFTESCNTAFIQLATGHLTAPDLPAAATMLGRRPQPAPRAGLLRRLGPAAIRPGRPGRHVDRAGPGPDVAAVHGHGGRGRRHRDGALAAAGRRRVREQCDGDGRQPAAVERGQRPARDDGVRGGQRHRGRSGPAGRDLRQDRDRPVRDDRAAQDRRLADGLQGRYRVRVPGG